MAKDKQLGFDNKVTAYLAYKQAREFNQSAQLLSENNLTNPTIVNSAFACELYMKALLMWNSSNSKVVDTHRLKELFEKLEPSIQNEIKSKSEIKRWDEFLANSSEAFYQWRYYFEKNKVLVGHIGGLLSFAEALEKKCNEVISLEEILV